MNPASGGEKCRQNMNMGAKSAPKTTKWGQKAPPHKSELKKVWGAKSAVKMQKWGQKVPSKQQSDGKKRHHSDKREKSHGGGKCHQNGKVVAENATKTVK